MVAVLKWFKRNDPSEAPLTGAPASPRMKSYSAASGYVYQYAFRGQRPARHGRDIGVEFAFDVTSDRKTMRRLWVFIADAAIVPWMEANSRELSGSERYGVAKLALRNAFDERDPVQILERIAPTSAEVNAILEELDV
jgi:hypothetical protein